MYHIIDRLERIETKLDSSYRGAITSYRGIGDLYDLRQQDVMVTAKNRLMYGDSGQAVHSSGIQYYYNIDGFCMIFTNSGTIYLVKPDTRNMTRIKELLKPTLVKSDI